jgi:hypothetical protein
VERLRRDATALDDVVERWWVAPPDEAERIRVVGEALRLVDVAAELGSISAADAPTLRNLPASDDDE